jgi:hypothetical protein
MTALTKYARLEASALWRAAPDAQRREVVVSIGDATLVISDLKDQALAHWSLAALERHNPNERPALFHPQGDPSETLELDDGEMIEAIDTLRRAVDRARPKPGRLRFLGLGLSLAAVVALAVFWLPGAMQEHTLRVVPQVKRATIGSALMEQIERASGPACKDAAGHDALAQLAARLDVKRVAVLPAMTQPSLSLPGNLTLLNRSVIEDFEEPDVAAGYIIAAEGQRAKGDPLRHLLNVVGLRENVRLLTTGDVSQAALKTYAEHLLTQAPASLEPDTLLSRFETAKVRSTPYAYALDITGETTLPMIEGDPMADRATAPLLPDSTWLRLQNICGG